VPDGTLIWQSDMDVLVTNEDILLEEHLAPFLPDAKDILLTLDSYGKMNCGSMLCRNTPWFRNFLTQVNSLTQFTFHPCVEGEAISVLYTNNKEVADMIQVINEPKRMNSYLTGLPGEPLWTPGDFIVHFYGVHDMSKMDVMIQKCLEARRVPSTDSIIICENKEVDTPDISGKINTKA
jgi:hypothetical protein